MAPGKVKINATWQDVAEVSAKVNGAWKTVTEGYNKVNGVWREWFLLFQSIAGYAQQGNLASGMYKLTYASGTWSTTTGYGVNTFNNTGFANAGVAGYSNTGQSPYTDMYKWSFPNDSVSTTTSAPDGMMYNMGFQNVGVSGYMTRSFTFSGNSNTMYKWSFANDSVSTTTDFRPEGTGPERHAGGENPAVAGYATRGDRNSEVYKFSFPTDVRSQAQNTPQTVDEHAGFSNAGVAIYFNHGIFGTTDLVFKVNVSNDTTSQTTTANTILYDGTGFQDDGTAGYFTRGNNNTLVTKYTFPTDTVSAAANTPANQRQQGGFENS